MASEAESFAEAGDVRVDDNTGRQSEGGAEDDVGRFAADAGEGDQGFDVAGELAVVAFDDGLAGGFNVFSLVAKEARALNDFFECWDGSSGHRRGIGPAAEKFGRHHVDADIGALGRENRGDKQFKRRFVFQGTGDVGVIGPQMRHDAVGLGLAIGGQFSGGGLSLGR